jgi:hypothetical protein
MGVMKRDAAEILKDALALPSEARAALAGSLLESLEASTGALTLYSRRRKASRRT